MGFIVYFMIGAALLTYSSVAQYNRDKEEFIRTRFRNWIWWAITLGCALLWPLLMVACIPDIVRTVKMLSR